MAQNSQQISLTFPDGAKRVYDAGLTVAEVAYRCGFRNPFHFSRLVRAHQGLPPRDVRRRAWGTHGPAPALGETAG